MSHELRWRTAVHEAGHAIVAVLIRQPLQFVTIEPERGALGRTVYRPRSVLDFGDHRAVEREMALSLAGFVAELVLDRSETPTGCDADICYAFRLAEEIGHGKAGFGRVVWRTTKMLMVLWPTVLVLAVALERHRRIGGRAMRRLVREELNLRRR